MGRLPNSRVLSQLSQIRLPADRSGVFQHLEQQTLSDRLEQGIVFTVAMRQEHRVLRLSTVCYLFYRLSRRIFC